MSTAKSPRDGQDGSSAKPPLALIAGPTASGKSALAVALAQAIETRGRRALVINADSAQVYRDLGILSARPSEAEMDGIEHRLFGTWDGGQACSAADWAAAAREEVRALHDDDAVPILCGGTGLYLRTLLDGIAPVPPIPEDVRREVRALAQPRARAALEIEDPSAASRLAPADTARTLRALEVVRATGKPLQWWQARKSGGIADQIDLAAAILLPDRDDLYRRCEERFAWMLENGAIEEVQALLERNLDPDLPVMRAIGVPEIAALLRGELTTNEAVGKGAMATRRYAKRQYTWFRRQPPADWTRHEYDSSIIGNVVDTMLHKLGLT